MVGPGRRKVLFDRGVQIGFEREPGGFGDDERAEDEDGLLPGIKIGAGVARFVEIDEVQLRLIF